ncbi:MAG: hypothetical protein CMC15_08070 [Flavobacteriaceae bacterium]|nr:hypothetical protein [Flavobacteriaceae bacterium]
MTKQPAHFPITDPSMLHRLLPHRSPMLLIDTVLSYTEQSIVCSYKVVQNSLFVIDSIFSESGIIEHMAQTVAVHTGYSGYLNQHPTREGYIGAIKSVEVMRLPKLGEVLTSEATILYSAMEMTLVAITSVVNEVPVARAEMSTILKPKPQ